MNRYLCLSGFLRFEYEASEFEKSYLFHTLVPSNSRASFVFPLRPKSQSGFEHLKNMSPTLSEKKD